MKPPITIGIYCTHEENLSRWRFVFSTRGYRVIACSSVTEACNATASDMRVMVIFRYWTDDEREKYLSEYICSLPRLDRPKVLFVDVFGGIREVRADRVLFQQDTQPAQIVEAVRILQIKKRGPIPALKVQALQVAG